MLETLKLELDMRLFIQEAIGKLVAGIIIDRRRRYEAYIINQTEYGVHTIIAKNCMHPIGRLFEQIEGQQNQSTDIMLDILIENLYELRRKK